MYAEISAFFWFIDFFLLLKFWGEKCFSKIHIYLPSPIQYLFTKLKDLPMLCRMFWNPKQNKTKWFRNKKYSYKCKQKRETMSCELFQISHKLNHLNQTKQKNSNIIQKHISDL